MKVKILIILSILFMFCASAYGKDIGYLRDIYPSAENEMAGVTYYSGVSVCQVLNIGQMSSIGGIGTFQWKSLSGATSITGISVFYRASNVDSAEAWAFTEQIPVVLNENTVTGDTNFFKTFVIPDTFFIRFEFECEAATVAVGENYGVTPYGVVQFRSGGDWRSYIPGIIGSEYLVLNVNSGISRLTVPDGTRTTRMSFNGGTVMSRSDGTDPGTTGETEWDTGDAWIIDGNKMGEASDVRFRSEAAAAGATIEVIYKN